ncbi:MAG: hypothetical protein QM689_10865 [Oscillospiraceae bacterium]
MSEEILNDAALAKINLYSRKTLTAGEVYTFPVILCDNEIDRDGERFSIAALHTLAELFVGKTGIFDHNPKGENQNARIYSAEIKADPARKTAAGEVYTYLYAEAYMVRTGKNADLIAEIDGGIKKEVSVSCAVKSHRCSICGATAEGLPCRHKKGRTYDGKLCHVILDAPADAYEWSFVAVPAQRGAGVTKRYGEGACGDNGEYLRVIERQNELVDALTEDLRGEVSKLCAVCEPLLGGDVVRVFLEKMEADELLSLKAKLRVPAHSRVLPVLADKPERAENNRGFKL